MIRVDDPQGRFHFGPNAEGDFGIAINGPAGPGKVAIRQANLGVAVEAMRAIVAAFDSQQQTPTVRAEPAEPAAPATRCVQCAAPFPGRQGIL